jgi:hypothetical protein
MKTKLIFNQNGTFLPLTNQIIHTYKLQKEVEISLLTDGILIHSGASPRANWEEKFTNLLKHTLHEEDEIWLNLEGGAIDCDW